MGAIGWPAGTMLTIPAIVAVLHIPLATQWLWEKALHRNARIA